ncbi:MAG: hypothetical protein EBW87_05985, partial [Burkholderiaceae bacterium]|nr:hypothetical protein [Burkholderiaceae bacterium]
LPDAIITTAELVDANVTQAKIATAVLPLTVGQTWQSVSRSNGTTYTNSTGRAIAVAISCWSSNQTGYFYINGSSLFLGLGRSSYFDTLPLFAIVPAGATYSTSGLDYIGLWMELR